MLAGYWLGHMSLDLVGAAYGKYIFIYYNKKDIFLEVLKSLHLQDKCFLNVADKNLNVVFTACGDGYYTCKDGQCIDIETR